MGMVIKAIELAKTHNWFLTRQFENEANPDFHSRTTAREIIDDFAGERLDYWVTGYGTGGTLKGVARVLAKDELFVDPKVRRRVEMMGAIPVFRGKNYGIRAVNAAGQRMMDVCATRMARGDDIAVFPEGTCNDVDPTQVQPIGSGIGHIAFRAHKLGVDPAQMLHDQLGRPHRLVPNGEPVLELLA